MKYLIIILMLVSCRKGIVEKSNVEPEISFKPYLTHCIFDCDTPYFEVNDTTLCVDISDGLHFGGGNDHYFIDSIRVNKK